MKLKNNRINYIIIFMALTAILLTGCQKKKEIKAEISPQNVKYSIVEEGEVQRVLSFTGTIKCLNSSAVRSKISGKVRTVEVEEGDWVRRGQVLITLEDDELQAQLRQAEAGRDAAAVRVTQARTGYDVTASTTGVQVQVAEKSVEVAKESVVQAETSLNYAKLELDRMTNLYNRGASPRQQLDSAQNQYDLAQSRLESAKKQVKQAEENLRLSKANTLQTNMRQDDISVASSAVDQADANIEYIKVLIDYTVIKAPMDGYITLKDVDPGEIIAPGDKNPALEITDNRIVYMESDIGEAEIGGLTKGTKVKVTVDALPGQTFDGTVLTIIPSANPGSRTFRVKIAIPNEENKLTNGMSSVGSIAVENLRGVVIPRYWMILREGDYYIAQEGEKTPDHKYITAKLQRVKVGFMNENQALITEGLKQGDRVLTRGHDSLKEGDIIEVSGQDSGGDVGGQGLEGGSPMSEISPSPLSPSTESPTSNLTIPSPFQLLLLTSDFQLPTSNLLLPTSNLQLLLLTSDFRLPTSKPGGDIR